MQCVEATSVRVYMLVGIVIECSPNHPRWCQLCRHGCYGFTRMPKTFNIHTCLVYKHNTGQIQRWHTPKWIGNSWLWLAKVLWLNRAVQESWKCTCWDQLWRSDTRGVCPLELAQNIEHNYLHGQVTASLWASSLGNNAKVSTKKKTNV